MFEFSGQLEEEEGAHSASRLAQAHAAKAGSATAGTQAAAAPHGRRGRGLLKLNQQTIRNWIDDGKLPAVRIGRRVRILRSDFQRLLHEGASAGTRQAGGAHDENRTAHAFWDGNPDFHPVLLPH